MASTKLTTKGQVTIPKKIREALRLDTGDKIEIIITKDNEAVIRPISKKVDEIFCKLHKPEQKVVPLKDIDQAIKTRMKKKYK